MSQELLDFVGVTMNEGEQILEQNGATNRGTRRQRHRLKKDEAYQPDYTILEAIVPEGLLTKAKAMVATNQRGHKATLRNLRSLEFHRGMMDEHRKLAEYHASHNEQLVEKLGTSVGDNTGRSRGRDSAIKTFLESLNDGALESVAQSKQVSMDLTRDDMIQALISVWNTPQSPQTAQAQVA